MTVSGLTLTGGGGTDIAGTGYTYAGGVWVEASVVGTSPTLRLEDSSVAQNYAWVGGGLWIVEQAWVQIVRTEIFDNYGYTVGGIGIQDQAEVELQDSPASYNMSVQDSAGGGMADDATLTCTGSSGTYGFHANRCIYGASGGLLVIGGTLIFDNCDWGTGVDDNLPYDLVVYDSLGLGEPNYGDDASFTCDIVSGCY